MRQLIVGVGDGHGLKTSGKETPEGYKENNFNHAVKLFLINELKRNGFKVVDVSPGREDTPLSNRVAIANTNNCDILISIHYNAMGNKWQIKAEGIETYYHGNSVKGKELATLIHNQLIQGTKQNNRGVRSDYRVYPKSGFYVLRKTKMPACLVECGFMDNKYDVKLMKSSFFQKECATEICQGICKYFGVVYKPEDEIIYTPDLIRENCLTNPIKWERTIMASAKLAGMSSNLGDLEPLKYLNEYTLKIFNYGRKVGN